MSGPTRFVTGALFVVVAAALWGCWSIIFRGAEAASSVPLPAARETAVVFVVMFLTMSPLALASRWRAKSLQVSSSTMSSSTTSTSSTSSSLPTRGAVDWGLLMILGLTDAANALCFFQAMQLTTVAIAVLCHYMAPVIVAVLSPSILGEPRRSSTYVALAVALFGLTLLLQPWSDGAGANLAGAGLALASAILYAANVFIGKKLFARFTTIEVAAWPKLTSMPALVISALVISGGMDIELRPLLWLIVGGVVCGTVPGILFNAGLRRLQAGQASILALMEPVVAVVVGVLMWHEPFTALAAVGATCTLCGAGMIARQGQGQSPSSSSPPLSTAAQA